MSILLGLLGDFWPILFAVAGGLFGVFGFQRAGAEKKKRKDAERRADNIQSIREKEHEASQLDDVSLADRISRRP